MIVGKLNLLRGEYSYLLLEPEEEIKRAKQIRDDAIYDLDLINGLRVKPGSAAKKCNIVARKCETEALRTLINGTCDEATALRKLRGAGEGLCKIISDLRRNHKTEPGGYPPPQTNRRRSSRRAEKSSGRPGALFICNYSSFLP
jgi:hypothetical protein